MLDDVFRCLDIITSLFDHDAAHMESIIDVEVLKIVDGIRKIKHFLEVRGLMQEDIELELESAKNVAEDFLAKKIEVIQIADELSGVLKNVEKIYKSKNIEEYDDDDTADLPF